MLLQSLNDSEGFAPSGMQIKTLLYIMTPVPKAAVAERCALLMSGLVVQELGVPVKTRHTCAALNTRQRKQFIPVNLTTTPGKTLRSCSSVRQSGQGVCFRTALGNKRTFPLLWLLICGSFFMGKE